MKVRATKRLLAADFDPTKTFEHYLIDYCKGDSYESLLNMLGTALGIYRDEVPDADKNTLMNIYKRELIPISRNIKGLGYIENDLYNSLSTDLVDKKYKDGIVREYEKSKKALIDYITNQLIPQIADACPEVQDLEDIWGKALRGSSQTMNNSSYY